MPMHRPRWRLPGAILSTALLAPFLSPLQARAEEHRFATALFHFNIQYAAGGLEGFLPFQLQNVFKHWELNDEQVQDMIIEQSFEPVLDLYLRHPTWGVNLELQGYFIEVLAERHPLVLDKLIRLVENGQADVISFHFSDQLFLGYGRPSWERSVDLTERVFEENGVRRSSTVFCQEGQAGVGMSEAMADHGYDLLVWPKNLWSYQHGDWDPAPYYEFGGLDMVVGSKDVNYNGGELQLTWTFLDDGELLATCDIDPYFPPVFRAKPRCIAEYEQELEDLEAAGWDIATVHEYLDEAKALGIPPTEPPPLFDGTWQPGSTNGIFRWLGGMGLWVLDERDNTVRTAVELAYREVMAAETIAHAAGLEAQDELDEIWRLLSLGTVTDATGVNPYKGEIGYGVALAGEASRRARDLIERAKTALGEEEVAIDTAAGTAAPGAAPPDNGVLTDAPLPVQIDAGGRTVTPLWYQVSEAPAIYRLDLAVGAGIERRISVTFPGDSPTVTFTPALTDDLPVTYDRADFVFDTWPMALANGFIGLDDRWQIVKDMGMTHVAAFISTSSGDVVFQDETAPPDSDYAWRFYLIDGSVDEAVAFANALNVYPTVYR